MAKGFLVFLENRNGRVKKGSLEALSAARSLADQTGAEVHAVVFGEGDAEERAARCGPNHLHKVVARRPPSSRGTRSWTCWPLRPGSRPGIRAGQRDRHGQGHPARPGRPVPGVRDHGRHRDGPGGRRAADPAADLCRQGLRGAQARGQARLHHPPPQRVPGGGAARPDGGRGAPRDGRRRAAEVGDPRSAGKGRRQGRADRGPRHRLRRPGHQGPGELTS